MEETKIDNSKLYQSIADVFNNNLGNKLSVELANGMLNSIQALLEQENNNGDNK